MSERIRAELLETARSLNSGGMGQLSIAALCKSTGLGRTIIRRHFPTNGALNTALKKEESVEAQSSQPGPELPITQGDWLEFRLRVFENTFSLLETRTEETVRNQSKAISLLEEKLSNLAAVPLKTAELPLLETRTEELARNQSQDTPLLEEKLSNLAAIPLISTEPPPIVVEPALQHPTREIEYTAENASSDLPSASLAIPNAVLDKSRLVFDARQKLQSTPEQAHLSARDATSAKLFELNRALPWMSIFKAVSFAALVLGVSLIWTRRPAGSKPASVTRTEPGHRRASDIIVIDATGNILKPPKQTVSASVRNIMARAEGGDASAQTQAALAFLRGDGVEADPGAAMRWSQAAAAQGEPNAQFILGSIYADGIKPNPQIAVRWYSAAAAQGNAKAMHNLAIAFLTGQGVAKDPAAAIGLLTKAAKVGYRDSAFDLAVLYERGEGVDQSPEEALRWYDAAASLGDLEAAERAKFLRSQLPRDAGN